MTETRKDAYPMVTVGLSTWNSALTIEACVESILNTAYPNKEIIVVDDGSTDDTLQRLAKYPIRVIHQQHQGVSAGRNNVLRHARGEIVVYTDSDTIVSNNWLDVIAEAVQDPSVGAICGWTEFRTDHRCASWIKSLDNRMRFDGRRRETSMVVGLNCAFRKKVLEEIGGFNPDWYHAEDTEVSYLIRQRGYRILLVPEALVEHVPEGDWGGYLRKRYRNAKAHMRVFLTHPWQLGSDDFLASSKIKVQMISATLVVASLVVSPLLIALVLVLDLPRWTLGIYFATVGLIWLFGLAYDIPLIRLIYAESGNPLYIVQAALLLLLKSLAIGLGTIQGILLNARQLPRFFLQLAKSGHTQSQAIGRKHQIP